MMVVDAATANFRSSGTPYQLPANTNLYLLNLNDTTVFENNKKVSFNIASEASYLHILSGKKFIKNAHKDKNWWKVPKFKCDIFGDF